MQTIVKLLTLGDNSHLHTIVVKIILIWLYLLTYID